MYETNQAYNPFDDEVQHTEEALLERRPFGINQVFWINIKHMLSIFMQILGGQVLPRRLGLKSNRGLPATIGTFFILEAVAVRKVRKRKLRRRRQPTLRWMRRAGGITTAT